MPLLDSADLAAALTSPPGRVLVAGRSGSGKTTLAARIGERLDLPHVEIDALFHGPDWTPRETFTSDVEALIASPGWVTEWQYSQVRPQLADAADLLVWLDLPKRVVMRQLIRRTLVRRLGRRELWNGNVEPPLRTFFTDEDHIVRWAWSSYDRNRRHVLDLNERLPDLPIVRCRSHADAARVVDALARVPLRP